MQSIYKLLETKEVKTMTWNCSERSDIIVACACFNIVVLVYVIISDDFYC